MFFVKLIDGPSHYYLLQGKEYTVGRKGTHILIADDKSVSRQHAIFKVREKKVYLVDCRSKFKTFINEGQVQPDVEVELKDGDVIKFGVFNSVFRLSHLDLTTCASGLTSNHKKQLKLHLETIGGEFTNEWTPECQYLTVQEILLTIKVLHAIIDEKPIVKLDFWEALTKCVREKRPPPDPKDFKPPIGEVLLNKFTLESNSQRRQVFKGKTFVFATDKLEARMDGIVEKAGGKSVSFQSKPIRLEDVVDNSDFIFITNADEVIPKDLEAIHDHVKEQGLRLIPVQEIAMAIISCSCEKDCNPNFDPILNVFAPNSQNLGPVLALESQEPNLNETDSQVIPDSFVPNLDLNTERIPIPTPMVTEEVPTSSNNKNDNVTHSQKRTSRESKDRDSVKRIKLSREQDIQPETETQKKENLVENPFALFKSVKSSVNTRSKYNPFCDGLVVPTEEKSHISEGQKRGEKMLASFSQSEYDTTAGTVNVENIKYEDTFSSDQIVTSTQIQPKRRGRVLSPLNLSPIRKTDLKNKNWFAKGSVKTANTTENFDADIKELYEKLKDTVIINKSIVVVKKKPGDSINYSKVSGNKLNFKKFKKIMPRKPQCTIIIADVGRVPGELVADNTEVEPAKKKRRV